jgi:hypothetical protein
VTRRYTSRSSGPPPRIFPADGAPTVAEYIEAFVPRSLVPQTDWDSTFRAFVIPAVEKLDPQGYRAAYQWIWALTKLAAWAAEEYLPLEYDVVLHPDTVARFIAATTATLCAESTPHALRTLLRRAGPRLTSRAPWEPPQRLPHRDVARPYSTEELQALETDARQQATALRRHGARALIALGAGAGLDGRWAPWVRGRDVFRGGDVVLVRVVSPNHPRLVPVLARYEQEVLELARIVAADDAFLLGGRPHRNRVWRINKQLEVGHGHPELSPSRLRATWLFHHLTVGTRLPELAKAAGVDSIQHIGALALLVPDLPEDEARRMLRGET